MITYFGYRPGPGAGRAPDRPAADIPGIRVLLVAELVAVGCAADGRCHLADERHFAERMLDAGPGPDLRALCARRLLPDSLLAGPRPACPDCLRAAEPRICDAVAARTPVARPRRGVVATLAATLVAALVSARPAIGGLP